MKKLQSYRFELLPSNGQLRLMRQFSGACRFVYNRALAWQNEQYEQDKEFKFSYTKIANLLPKWKQEPTTVWLKECPSQALQQALKHLERGFKNFFASRAAFPTFKKRGRHDSFSYPQGFKVEGGNNRVFLPKLGWVRYRNSRKVEGTAKNITVSHHNGKWYMAVQTEQEVETPVHPSCSIVGIDLGVAKFAALSNGEIFWPVHSFKNKQQKLAKLQSSLSKKIKFSSNWHKTKHKITKLHGTITDIRKDYLHKTSSYISKNHAMIVIEDLQVSNMSTSAKGTREQPGKNVRAKSGLNKSILDQGWYQFRRFLEYKQEWRGGTVQVVNPRYTSQTCSQCGHISKDNRPTQARFECVVCAYHENADINAARNILAAGHAVLACGEKALAFSVKQEPSEFVHAVA